jgi:hypothetical protein
MSEQVVPQVHLNGTSKEELVDQLRTVLTHLRAAEEALQLATPNGRDYYHTGNYEAARAQHVSRVELLGGLIEDIFAQAIAISDQ